MGRPKAKVDEVLVEELAGFGCTKTEIAAACKCSVDTLDRRFADKMAKGFEIGKKRLRKSMWNSALSGNVVAQIFLCKNVLGMADKIESKAEVTQDVKMELTPEMEKKIKAAAQVVMNDREILPHG